MENNNTYFMEHEEESIRLDIKTNTNTLKKQALWAGIAQGTRVADIGCGPGKTTYYLNQLVQPGGEVVGFDFSEQRLKYAKENYSDKNISFICKDFTKPISNIESFDFIWIRFVLEYFKRDSFTIVKNLTNILKPGGTLCLIDLDCNCLRIHGLTEQINKIITDVISKLEMSFDFDPYVGIKLYSYLYDLNFENIEVKLEPHNLIYGQLKPDEAYNWMKKIEIACKKTNHSFENYSNGLTGFLNDIKQFFFSERRFTYTPLILCKGQKPVL